MSRAGDTPGCPALRLEWSAVRDGVPVTVAALLGQPPAGPAFERIEMLAGDGVPAWVREPLRAGVAGVAAVADPLAVEGFLAPGTDSQPISFTLAVSLAEVGHPEATYPERWRVTSFPLPCGPGVRVQRLCPVALSGPVIVPVFTSVYLAQTGAGVLSLSFATPHVDAALEFAELFDAIAGSCMVR